MSQLPTERETEEKIVELRTQAAHLMYKATLLTEQAARLEDSLARVQHFEPESTDENLRFFASDVRWPL